MKDQIEKALQPLIHLPLWHWLRAADMECFGFGASHSTTNRQGETIEVAEWALHIQCTWRIVGPNGIVAGRRDLYYPAVEQPDLDLMEYDYDGPIPNRRDVRLKDLFTERDADPLVVDGCSADDVGGFRLTLTDGFALEVFPDDSMDGEHWRLFQRFPKGFHFVVTGRGIT